MYACTDGHAYSHNSRMISCAGKGTHILAVYIVEYNLACLGNPLTVVSLCIVCCGHWTGPSTGLLFPPVHYELTM